ncbi:hypothetical protein [Auraticoccus monumenti]|uniref:Uncharacterized protein n=1 Tax=Auraticoccus monumenti TaxID=675864 RepID=A0A1G7A3Q0_9ACTN|nr:hypothetical protein [Auraticoccus monumenti]SDE09410.1 hypothetical protein SAMN04489747_2494 [Auraticoccus monumenti]
MSGRPTLPPTLAAARGALAPLVLGVVPERIRSRALQGTDRDDLALVTRGPFGTLLGAGLQVGSEVVTVTAGLAREWGVEATAVLTAAFEDSRSVLGRTRLELVQPGTYRSVDPELPAWLLHTDLVADRVVVPGERLLLVPTADCALLTGTGDWDGLRTVAELASRELRDHPQHAVSREPLVWRHGGWQQADWPSGREAAAVDRARAEAFARARGDLVDDYSRACEMVRPSARAGDLPLRRYREGRPVATAELDGWFQLAALLGDVGIAAEVRATARAAEDVRLGQGVGGLAGAAPSHAPEQLLATLLDRRGVTVIVDRGSHPAAVAAEVSDSPTAQAAGVRIELDPDLRGAVEIAEAVSVQLRPAGWSTAALGDLDSSVRLVHYPSWRADQVRAALDLIGDPMLLTWF